MGFRLLGFGDEGLGVQGPFKRDIGVAQGLFKDNEVMSSFALRRECRGYIGICIYVYTYPKP